MNRLSFKPMKDEFLSESEKFPSQVAGEIIGKYKNLHEKNDLEP